ACCSSLAASRYCCGLIKSSAPAKRGRGTAATGPAQSGRPDDKLRAVEGGAPSGSFHSPPPPSHGGGETCASIKLVRQDRQRSKRDAFLVQFLGLFGRRFAVDRAVLDFAVMDLARLLGKARPDIVRVLDDMLAQLFELLAQLVFDRRHHRDRR